MAGKKIKLSDEEEIKKEEYKESRKEIETDAVTDKSLSDE